MPKSYIGNLLVVEPQIAPAYLKAQARMLFPIPQFPNPAYSAVPQFLQMPSAKPQRTLPLWKWCKKLVHTYNL
jgi:hypothetical protein